MPDKPTISQGGEWRWVQIKAMNSRSSARSCAATDRPIPDAEPVTTTRVRAVNRASNYRLPGPSERRTCCRRNRETRMREV